MTLNALSYIVSNSKLDAGRCAVFYLCHHVFYTLHIILGVLFLLSRKHKSQFFSCSNDFVSYDQKCFRGKFGIRSAYFIMVDKCLLFFGELVGEISYQEDLFVHFTVNMYNCVLIENRDFFFL